MSSFLLRPKPIVLKTKRSAVRDLSPAELRLLHLDKGTERSDEMRLLRGGSSPRARST